MITQYNSIKRCFCRAAWRCAKGSISVLLVIALVISPDMWLYAQTASSGIGDEQLADEFTRAETIDTLQRFSKAMEAFAEEIPREGFDPGAVVELVGRSPEALFAWVRDNTWLVPYKGVLRGWKGVLMDRLGNSLDRALLLEKLLKKAGHDEVRLANAQLSAEDAARLARQARAMPAEGVDLPTALPSGEMPTKGWGIVTADKVEIRLNGEESGTAYQGQAVKIFERTDGWVGVELISDGAGARTGWVRPDQIREATPIDLILRRHMSGAGFNKAEMIKMMEQNVQRKKAQAQAIAKRVPAQTEALLKLIGDLRVPQDEPDKTPALRDHWWVQVRQGDEWIELDPSFPDATVGSAPFDAARTLESAELPDDLHHEITIRVQVERWEENALKVETALEHTLRPRTVIGNHIALTHYPYGWPEDLHLVNEENPEKAFRETVAKQDEWVPILTVGATNDIQRGFTADGRVRTKPATAAGELGETTGGLFDIVTKTIEKSAGVRNDTRLTAEWIEYEIRSPGRDVRVIRRQIFDSIGPARRAKGEANGLPKPELTKEKKLHRNMAMMGRTKILPLACQLSPAYYSHLLAKRTAAATSMVAKLLHKGDEFDMDAAAKAAQNIEPAPGILYQLVLVRWAWTRHQRDVYLDRPNILSHHGFPCACEDKESKMHLAIDIVANDVAVRPGAIIDPFELRLAQGVLDSNAEVVVLEGEGDGERGAYGSASALLDRTLQRSDAAADSWVGLTDADADLDALALSTDAKQRLRDALRAGSVVVAPREAPGSNASPADVWWTVDPATGTTLAMGVRGWGQSAAEYGEVLEFMLDTVLAIFCLAFALDGYYQKGQPSWVTGGRIVLCMAGLGTAASGSIGVTSGRAWSVVGKVITGIAAGLVMYPGTGPRDTEPAPSGPTIGPAPGSEPDESE